jgi:hypothetical protein
MLPTPVAQSCTQCLWELFHFAKIFSCGESQSQFLRVRFLGSHQRSEDGPARLGDEVTMGMRQLSNQAMGAQQAQLTAHRRGAAPRRLFVPWFAQIEQALATRGRLQIRDTA